MCFFLIMKDTKIINSTCICKHRLNSIDCEIIMMEPCEHLIHIDCLKSRAKCPFCKLTIIGFTTLRINNNKILTQKEIDILSTSSVNNLINKNNFNIFTNVPYFLYIASKIQFAKSSSDIKNICESIFSMANIALKVNNKSKTYNNDKKVFISNHVGYLDAIILYYLLECGFLGASSVKNDIVFGSLTNIVPTVFVSRGTKQNTVNAMKEFVKKHGSICLFPEGMFSYPGTLSRFRTGAFQINEPIYPIILKYSNGLLDSNIKNLALKLGSNNNESIEVTFLDPIYPPFNSNTPEIVRDIMAKNNLLLSRVLGNDYYD